MRYWFWVGLVLFLGAVLSQAIAHRHLAPEWEGKLERVQRSLPQRVYFTEKGWRYQLIAAVLAVAGVLIVLTG